jgi:ABC-type uncharacterized transport system permease subunit
VLPQRHPVPGLSAVSVSPRLALLHISSASLGIALFGVAAATSVLYLVSERRLKRGRLPRAAGAEAGPSLEFLDRLNRHSIIFGLLTFTAALVSGTYWLLEAPLPGSRPDEPGLLLQVSHLLSQSRYTLAMVTWLLFAGLLVGRAALGLRGRRAAQVTLLGFCTSIGVLAFYLWRDMAGH